MAVITISRQLESLGDDVARLVAAKLGYQIFDKKAMAQVGQEMGLAASVITEAAEFRPAAKSLLERWFGNAQRLTGGDPSSWTFSARADALQDLTVANLVDIINAGYKKGNVVIIGRGGMAALQNKPDVFHVRVIAPMEVRLQRMMDRERCLREDAVQKIKARDASDVEWINRYFDLDSHDPQLFDLVISTAKITPAAAADLVINALASASAKAK